MRDFKPTENLPGPSERPRLLLFRDWTYRDEGGPSAEPPAALPALGMGLYWTGPIETKAVCPKNLRRVAGA